MNAISKDETIKYLKDNQKYFNQGDLKPLAQRIFNSKKSLEEIKQIKLRSPAIATIISLFLGLIGIDRFYIGSYVYGVIKLLTFSCGGILWVIDWFLIRISTKNCNCNNVYIKLGLTTRGEVTKAAAKNFFAYIRSKEFRTGIKKIKAAGKNVSDSFDLYS